MYLDLGMRLFQGYVEENPLLLGACRPVLGVSVLNLCCSQICFTGLDLPLVSIRLLPCLVWTWRDFELYSPCPGIWFTPVSEVVLSLNCIESQVLQDLDCFGTNLLPKSECLVNFS